MNTTATSDGCFLFGISNRRQNLQLALVFAQEGWEVKNTDKIKNTSSGYNCNYFLIKYFSFCHHIGTVLLKHMEPITVKLQSPMGIGNESCVLQ